MGATTLVVNDRIGLAPRLVEITEDVYSATGCAFSHLFFVVTHRSVVVIDTTESMAAALSDFRKISALPISHLIYATITPTTTARPKPSKPGADSYRAATDAAANRAEGNVPVVPQARG
jgi:hypothetical protein